MISRIFMARTATFLGVLLGAASAWACPSCAGRDGGVGEIIMLGVGIAMPFVVVFMLIPVLRRASDQELDAELIKHIESNRGGV